MKRPSPTRTSLRACMAEGVVAEIIAACCGGAALTAWAFQLEASATLIGVLWGLSYFSQALQFPAAWITSRFGRRRVAIAGHAASRLILLGLVPLPFLPVAPSIKQTWLLVILWFSAVFVMVGHNAWLTWVTDLVPARIRGRFFGKRTAYATAVGTSVAVTAGLLLDRARAKGDAAWTLAIMAAIGWCAGLGTTWLMSKQHEPGNEPDESMRFRDVLAPLKDRASRRLLAYQVVWNAAVGLTASVAAVYMLRELHVGFVGVGLYNAALAGARILSAPLWGRGIDRVGSRPILIICALGAALTSALWVAIVPGKLWLIALEAVLTGLLIAGHEVALFAIPMAVAPRSGRPVHLAAFAMVAGVAFGLASTAGGAASGWLASATIPFGPRALFLVSSSGRLAAAAIGASLLEPNARSLWTMFRERIPWLEMAARRVRNGHLPRELSPQRGATSSERGSSRERPAVSGM